jgi:glycosyltransferase involved in cell wall biosynthesis
MSTREKIFNIFAVLLAAFNVGTSNGSADTYTCSDTSCVKAKPRASIITSVFKGDFFIRKFLEDITNIKNFADYELILINANSPGNEEPIIKEYLEHYPNIIYKRLEKDPGVYGVWNLGIKMAKADFVTNSNLDDRRNPDALENHVEFLGQNPGIDLVYSSYYITYAPNETFQNNTYRYVVEAEEFTGPNMYKCLPGPQPTWRKSMHEKCGYFREDMKHSGDLELWNRAVTQGSKFARVPGFSTLFYMNPEGLSTSTQSIYATPRQLEDAFIRGAYGYRWNTPPADTPRLLIKMPTRSRPQQFFKQLDNYYRKLSQWVPYHFLITCDEDDASMNNPHVQEKLSWYPNLTVTFNKNTSKIEAYNRDLDLIRDYDVLLAVGDDMEPIIHAYDKVIVEKMRKHFPDFDGVLNFHDGYVDARLITYPVVGKKFYQRFGYLFHPFYKSLFANEELTVVSKLLSRQVAFDDILIRHNHPAWGAGAWDALYSRNEALKEFDRSIFNMRREHNFYLDNSNQKTYSKVWSILICTLDERENTFNLLHTNLLQQIASAGLNDKIEVLFFKDNRKHTVGYKRNELVKRSNGKYISFIDDDDLVDPYYVKTLYEKLLKDPDCVSLIGTMTTQGHTPQTFMHSIDFKEKKYENGIWKSPPNHLNPIRSSIASQFLFPEKNFAEDFDWQTRIAQSNLLKKEEKVDKPYYFYRYDGKYHGSSSNSSAVAQYYVTAADHKYFEFLLNLIASIHETNFDHLGEIAVANIGLTQEQIDKLNSIEKVRVFEVERANPDILKPFVVNKWGKEVPGWYSFKPVTVKQALDRYPYVLWIDASSIVLKPLDNLFKHIQQNGYFVATIGNEIINGKYRFPMRWCTTKRVIEAFGLNEPELSWVMDAEQIMTTTFGISKDSAPLFTDFFETSKDISLFIDDGSTPDGIGTGRHDQTVLSIFAYTHNLIVHKQDYTQEKPMPLMVDAKEMPFYMTWHAAYVNNKTDIYSARGNSASYTSMRKSLHYKT